METERHVAVGIQDEQKRKGSAQSALTRKDSSVDIESKTRQLKHTESLTVSEELFDLIIPALGLDKIDKKKLKNKTFLQTFQTLLTDAKANKRTRQELLARVLGKTEDSAGKTFLFDSLTQGFNEELIFELKSILEDLIAKEEVKRTPPKSKEKSDKAESKEKTELSPKSKSQINAEANIQDLNNTYWDSTKSGMVLVRKHIEEPLKKIKAAVLHYHLTGDKEAFFNMAETIAREYLVGVGLESNRWSMKAIPKAVRKTSQAIFMSAVIKYYSNPNPEKCEILEHDQPLPNGKKIKLRIPYPIICEFWKNVTALQLNRATTEDIADYSKDLKAGKEKAATHLFTHDSLIEDLAKTAYSSKFLSHFELAKLDEQERKAIIEYHPQVAELKLQDIQSQFGTILDTTPKQKLESNESILFDNFKTLLEDTQKKSKRISEQAKEISKVFLPELIGELRTESDKICDKMLKAFDEYITNNRTEIYRNQLTDSDFVALIEAIATINLRKNLNDDDTHIVTVTLENGLENIRKFSNKELGNALYNGFMEALPIKEDDIDKISLNLKSKNYVGLTTLSNKILGKALQDIFLKHTNHPSNSDIKKILKSLKEKDLSKLLKLKDQALGVALHRAFFAAIPFPETDINHFIQCLKKRNIEHLTQITNTALGAALLKAFKENSLLLPGDDVQLICDTLKNRHLNNLSGCINKELGERLHKALFQFVAPTKKDKKILEDLMPMLNKLPSTANVSADDKKNILENLKEYSNKEFIKHLKETINTTPIQGQTLKQALTILGSYDNIEELQTSVGKFGEDIYHALARSIPLTEEDVKKIQQSLKKKSPEKLKEIKDQKLAAVMSDVFFKDTISYSTADIILFEKIFVDRYQDLALISNETIAKALYDLFTANQPDLTHDDIKKIVTGLSGNPENIRNISDSNFGKILCDKILEITVTDNDRLTIIKCILSGNFENINNISNPTLRDSVNKALAKKDLTLKRLFEFSSLQKALIYTIVTSPNKILLFLGNLTKKKEEKPLISMEELPGLIDSLAKGPAQNLQNTFKQILNAPFPSFMQNILDQLKVYITDPPNQFYQQLKKLIYSTTFVLRPFNVLVDTLTSAIQNKDNNNLVLLQTCLMKVNNQIKQLEKFVKDFNILFKSKDFFQTYQSLSSSSQKELAATFDHKAFHSSCSLFVTLVLFINRKFQSTELDAIVADSEKAERIILQAFTFQALNVLGMSKREWPSFLQNENHPLWKELIDRIAKLGTSEVTGYTDDGTEIKQSYDQLLKTIFLRMTIDEFTDEDPFYQFLIKYCAEPNELLNQKESKSEESFEFLKKELRVVPKRMAVSPLGIRLKQIALENLQMYQELSQKGLLKELMSYTLTVLIEDENFRDATTIILYCISVSPASIEAACLTQLITKIKPFALKSAILSDTSNNDEIRTILKEAGKLDLTIFTCKNENECPFYLAYQIEHEKNPTPKFTAIFEHLVATRQPWPIAQLLYKVNEKQMERHIRKQLKEALDKMGLNTLLYTQKTPFHSSSPKTTTSSHSGEGSSAEDKEEGVEKEPSNTSSSEVRESTESSSQSIYPAGKSALESIQKEKNTSDLFANNITQGSISIESLQKFLQDDPQASFLIDYLQTLLREHDPKKPKTTDKILKNFIPALKDTAMLMPPENRKLLVNESMFFITKLKNLYGISSTTSNSILELHSWLDNEKRTPFESFETYISQDTANEENLKKLLTRDPTAMFLGQYLRSYIDAFNKEVQGVSDITAEKISQLNQEGKTRDEQKEIIDKINTERDETIKQITVKFQGKLEKNAKKFAEAVKTTINHIPIMSGYLNDIIQILTSSIQQARSTLSFYIKSIDDLESWLALISFKALPLMLNKTIGITTERVVQIFKLNNQKATEHLRNYILELSKDDIQLKNILEILITKEIVFFDNKNYVINMLLPSLKDVLATKKNLSKKKNSLSQLLQDYSKQLAEDLNPKHLTFSFSQEPTTKSFTPAYAEKLPKDDREIIENQLNQLVKTGDKKITDEIVLGLFQLDARITIQLVKNFTENFYNESYGHNFGLLVSLLETINNLDIKHEGKLVIGNFEPNIKSAATFKTPGSNQITFSARLLDIVNSYKEKSLKSGNQEDKNEEARSLSISAAPR